MQHVEYKKPLVGLYSMGLRAYWSQFPGSKIPETDPGR